MLVNREAVPRELVRHKTPYWKVFAGRNLVSSQVVTIDIHESAQILRELLEQCSGDTVTVKIYTERPAKEAEKGEVYTYEVELKDNSISKPREHKTGGQNENFSQIVKLLEEKNELKIEVLKLQLKAESSQGENKFLEKLLPMLQPLLIGIAGKLAAPAQIGAPKVQIREVSILQDRDFENTLRRIKERDPETYNSIKEQINQALEETNQNTKENGEEE